MHVLKPFVQRPLTSHDYFSRSDDKFGQVGADAIVHLPSLADLQPEKNASYGPSYFAFFSENPFLDFFLGGDLSGPLLIPLAMAGCTSMEVPLSLCPMCYRSLNYRPILCATV